MEVLALQSGKNLTRTGENDPGEEALLKLSQQNESCFSYSKQIFPHIFRKTELYSYSPCL